MNQLMLVSKSTLPAATGARNMWNKCEKQYVSLATSKRASSLRPRGPS